MRKLFALLLAVLMLAALCVCVFADTDQVDSPTAPKEYIIEFIDYGPGDPPDSSTTIVPEGETGTYKVYPNSPYEFLGFEIEGEYEIVEGSLNGPYIVVRPLTDLVIVAKYEGVPVTVSPTDTSNNGPQTGFNPLWITIAFAALTVCAVASILVVKRMAKKES